MDEFTAAFQLPDELLVWLKQGSPFEWSWNWEKEQSDVVSPHLRQADLFLQLALVFLLLSLGPQCRYCSSHSGLQGTDGLGQRRAYSRLQRLPAPGVRRSQAVEPANLTYLEAEEEKSFYPFMLAKSNVGKLLPLILPLHSKQIKALQLNLHFPEAFSSAGVRRKGGFIYRCCFQNEPSIVILSVNTSLGIRHLSIYLEAGDKDCLTWE